MKKLLLAFVVLSACTRTTTTTSTGGGPPVPVPPPTSGNQLVGGSTPRLAVEQFLAAVKAQDIQAMSVVFGTSRGPSRDNMDHDQLDKRLVILQCFFNHDAARVYGETPGDDGHRVFTVELTRGRLTRTPHFYTVQGPGGRWFVDNMEISVVREFCSKS
ncbi:MAG TPA: hypothetical protein VM099_09160 [Gemmatimonadaceae bacterium]|nr:hypothetical protein [Gemmatimonadaceae bacterium]